MKAAQVIEQKNVLYSRVFNTQEGREVLEDLISLYLPDRLGIDLIKVGESNVIRHIQRRLKDGMA